MEVLALAITSAALVVAGIALWFVRQTRSASSVSSGTSVLLDHAELERRLATLELSSGTAATDGARPVQGSAITHIGVVRFATFEDAGGAQSFAVALLDDAVDGIVLTSLHARPGTSVYGKAIRAGVTDGPLSEEEEKALEQAGLRRRRA